MESLKLALIHFNARHKKNRENREELITLATQAAQKGAKIIAAPEMSLSGYSFQSRDDIMPHTETSRGETVNRLSRVAKEFGAYICFGMAEKGSSGILYNSAFALGPKGNILCRYRKINAESRWACPGNPGEDNTFETPWGRVGILICSDTYYGLMPRVTALRGARLVIVPANWPPSGLNPQELWRARATENGFHLAAANRTGIDLIMDCRRAKSSVHSPTGLELMEGKDEDSRIFQTDLPLNSRGRLDDSIRQKIMNSRRPKQYHDCYLNLRMIRDFTSFLELPKPGILNVHCLVPTAADHPVAALEEKTLKTGGMYILPTCALDGRALDIIKKAAREKQTNILISSHQNGGKRYCLFQENKEPQTWQCGNEAPFPHLDVGPARIAIAPFDALKHPELAVASSKKGCDMAVASEEHLTADDPLLAGARSIENIILAVSAQNRAGIWVTPQGHQRWEEFSARPGSSCSYPLDTKNTRSKRFQDNIDFGMLLNSHGNHKGNTYKFF